MEKSQIIEKLTREFMKRLHPLGVAHLTVYITGGTDLFSPNHVLRHVPFENGEISWQDLDVEDGPFPTTIFIKKNNF